MGAVYSKIVPTHSRTTHYHYGRYIARSYVIQLPECSYFCTALDNVQVPEMTAKCRISFQVYIHSAICTEYAYTTNSTFAHGIF